MTNQQRKDFEACVAVVTEKSSNANIFERDGDDYANKATSLAYYTWNCALNSQRNMVNQDELIGLIRSLSAALKESNPTSDISALSENYVLGVIARNKSAERLRAHDAEMSKDEIVDRYDITSRAFSITKNLTLILDHYIAELASKGVASSKTIDTLKNACVQADTWIDKECDEASNRISLTMLINAIELYQSTQSIDISASNKHLAEIGHARTMAENWILRFYPK
jgi:hypothetical protein